MKYYGLLLKTDKNNSVKIILSEEEILTKLQKITVLTNIPLPNVVFSNKPAFGYIYTGSFFSVFYLKNENEIKNFLFSFKETPFCTYENFNFLKYKSQTTATFLEKYKK